MDVDLENYFIKNPDTPQPVKQDDPDKSEKIKANIEFREKKASEQIKMQPVSISQVFSYVNEFLELVKSDCGVKEKTVQIKQIKMDNNKHIIADNGIIAVNCQWTDSQYDKGKNKYT